MKKVSEGYSKSKFLKKCPERSSWRQFWRKFKMNSLIEMLQIFTSCGKNCLYKFYSHLLLELPLGFFSKIHPRNILQEVLPKHDSSILWTLLTTTFSNILWEFPSKLDSGTFSIMCSFNNWTSPRQVHFFGTNGNHMF